jgi:hypothetical protein
LIRRLAAIGHRRLDSTRAYLPLPPELKVVLAPDKLILEHTQAGKVVSTYLQIDLEDCEPSAAHDYDPAPDEQ